MKEFVLFGWLRIGQFVVFLVELESKKDSIGAVRMENKLTRGFAMRCWSHITGKSATVVSDVEDGIPQNGLIAVVNVDLVKEVETSAVLTYNPKRLLMKNTATKK